jgi:hypothetical protein
MAGTLVIGLPDAPTPESEAELERLVGVPVAIVVGASGMTWIPDADR